MQLQLFQYNASRSGYNVVNDMDGELVVSAPLCLLYR